MANLGSIRWMPFAPHPRGATMFGRSDLSAIYPKVGVGLGLRSHGSDTNTSFAISGALGLLMIQGRGWGLGLEASERVEYGDGSLHDFAMIVIAQLGT